MEDSVMTSKVKLPDLEEMPERLRKNLVKLMAAENLDYAQALDRAGLLLEQNSEAYRKAVEAEGNTRYKSRFLSELNKSRVQWKAEHEKELESQRSLGWEQGQTLVRRAEFALQLPCSVCGKMMFFSSNDANFADQYEVLKEAFKNWSHGHCSPESQD
jgi:hypothetical protein